MKIRLLMTALAIAAFTFNATAQASENSKGDANASSSDSPWETGAQCQGRLKDAMGCFLLHARYSRLRCGLQAQLAILDQSWTKVSSCIGEAKDVMKPFYSTLSKQLSKRRDALNMLKDTYSYWGASIEAIGPQDGENKITYSSRQARESLDVEAKLKRLELEQ